MDLWGPVVFSVARRGRVDVHSLHPEPLCDLPGQIRGSHPARHIPKHHVHGKSEDPHRQCMGSELRHLLPSSTRVERRGDASEQHIF